MVKRPAFFKFYLAGRGDENTKIPSMFVHSIQRTLPENVVLRDRYNNLWQMKVEQVGDNWYFKDGWIEFANDNMIEGGDMLIYGYFSDGLFDFKIFGSSACEKKGVGYLRYKNAEAQNNMVESKDAVVDDTDDDDNVPTTSEVNQKDDSHQQDDSPRGGQVTVGGTSTSAHGNTRGFDWFGAEIFGPGLLPQPLNPYFVTKTRRNRACELYIPVDCIKNLNLQLPETIMLVDPRGRRFQAKRKMWRDGRMFYTEGWKRLCRVNLVGNDDKCICEFIQEDGEDLYLSVTFFRANRQQS